MADALDVLATYSITHLNGYLITWYTRQSPFASLLQYHPSSTNPNHIIAGTISYIYISCCMYMYTKHHQSVRRCVYPRPLVLYIVLVYLCRFIYYYVVVPSTKYSILFQVVNITQSQFPLVLFVLFYLYPFSLRYIHIMKIYKLNLFLLSLGFFFGRERGFVRGMIGDEMFWCCIFCRLCTVLRLKWIMDLPDCKLHEQFL